MSKATPLPSLPWLLLAALVTLLPGPVRAQCVGFAQRQLYASAKFRDLAERSLDVEQRRFLNGLSSNFLVAQRQAELGSLIQHEKATSDLQLAMGDLLEARHLRFELRPSGSS